MRLRPFRPSDLETLYEIDHACFAPGVSYSWEEMARFIAHSNSKTWVAEEGDSIIGFAVAERRSGRVGHIVTIDVVEQWRRHGVGKALMDAAEDWARQHGLGFIYLETAADNLVAQAFYEARDYVKLQKRERYYANGKAAWVMMKSLE